MIQILIYPIIILSIVKIPACSRDWYAPFMEDSEMKNTVGP